MDGNGRGYPGAVASNTALLARALSGQSPSGTNGHGKGGRKASDHTGNGGGITGGGGGSHGKFLFFVLLFSLM